MTVTIGRRELIAALAPARMRLARQGMAAMVTGRSHRMSLLGSLDVALDLAQALVPADRGDDPGAAAGLGAAGSRPQLFPGRARGPVRGPQLMETSCAHRGDRVKEHLFPLVGGARRSINGGPVVMQ